MGAFGLAASVNMPNARRANAERSVASELQLAERMQADARAEDQPDQHGDDAQHNANTASDGAYPAANIGCFGGSVVTIILAHPIPQQDGDDAKQNRRNSRAETHGDGKDATDG